MHGGVHVYITERRRIRPLNFVKVPLADRPKEKGVFSSQIDIQMTNARMD